LSGGRVAVVEAGDDIKGAVEEVIGLVGGLRLRGGEHVVIKPNVCNAKNPYGMVNTDFRIIEAVVDLVRDEAEKVTVVESDNISGSADKRVAESGLLGELKKMDVEFLNLSGDEFEVHEVAGKKLRLPRTVLDADYFINLPKVKTEGHVSVTLSIKNLFGVPQRAKKSSLHRRLNEILPYLAGAIRHDLIVVDGVVAMEGNGPLIGTPKELGVVVAGENPVSVDAVCARMMGFDTREIEYLVKAHEKGLGEMDLDSVEVVGADWRGLAQEFERPYSLRATLKSVKTIRKVYL
jgi:uncharacterized protein (DUF362 family)